MFDREEPIEVAPSAVTAAVRLRSESADALDAYLRNAGDHRLLAAHEEKDIAYSMRAARTVRASALFEWNAVPQMLLTEQPQTVLEANAPAHAEFVRLRPSAHRLGVNARRALAALPWRESAMRPHIDAWTAWYRRTQQVERGVRQLCLYAAGMPRRYYAERLPVDLSDTRWLARAARAGAIGAEAYEVLKLELAPVLAPLQTMARASGMNVGALRRGYTRLHSADRDYLALRNELARHNLRLVIAMARKYERPGMPLADLIQEGNVGLLRAIDKFDPDLGYRFSTYATWWVRQALQRAQLEQGRVVRVPAHVQEEARLLYRTTESFVHRHGREPRNEELSRLSGVALGRLDALRALFSEALSLDVPRHDDGDETWHASLPDEFARADSERERDELTHHLDRLLDGLPADQARVLRMRYGVGVRAEHSPEALRGLLGLSPPRIRELEQAALTALRERSEALRPFLEE